jgi:hypothetical protein
LDAGVEPLPNDKALKDKKKKLRETLERLQNLCVSVKHLKVTDWSIYVSCWEKNEKNLL